jgi:hypothetical protein
MRETVILYYNLDCMPIHKLHYFIGKFCRHHGGKCSPLTKLYKPDQPMSAVSAHFCNFHIKGGISLKQLDQMCVFLGYIQINMHLL